MTDYSENFRSLKEPRSLKKKALHAVLIALAGPLCGALLGALFGAIVYGVGDEGSHGLWAVAMIGYIGFQIGVVVGILASMVSFAFR